MSKTDLQTVTDALLEELKLLHFSAPVQYVYNPLTYARKPYDLYLQRYGSGVKEIVLLGMNPGPWGMAQTGVPFGEVTAVREWLGIVAPVEQPPRMHPKRPVEGFACPKSEVSGRRLWGWARKRFHSPERFFLRFFVANYCPLIFIEDSGRNRTPNAIRAAERKPLLEICDRALRSTIECLQPRHVIGIGQFAEQRAQEALRGIDVRIGKITHPSPANPRANRGWDALIEQELASLGIRIP